MNNLYAVFLNNKCIGAVPRGTFKDGLWVETNRASIVNDIFVSMGFYGRDEYLDCLPGRDAEDSPNEIETSPLTKEYDIVFNNRYGDPKNPFTISLKDLGIYFRDTNWAFNPRKNNGEKCMFLLQPCTDDVRRAGYDDVENEKLWFCSDWENGKMMIKKTKPMSIDKSVCYSKYRIPFDYGFIPDDNDTANLFIGIGFALIALFPIFVILAILTLFV